MATCIGPEIFGANNGWNSSASWGKLDRSLIIRQFKAWLGTSENEHSIFIVDDLDGLRNDTAIDNALPREAPFILFSTRDPSIIEGIREDCTEIFIPAMESSEVIQLMKAVKNRLAGSHPALMTEELASLETVVKGHPQAAWLAISYIVSQRTENTKLSSVEAFLAMFEGQDWKARKEFLEYQIRLRPSIKATFDISLARLRHNTRMARKTLELISFFSTPSGLLDFHTFLEFKRDWLENEEVVRKIRANHRLFTMDGRTRSGCLAALKNVSVIVPSKDASAGFQVHPLLTEYVLQNAGHTDRAVWLRHLLFLCHESWTRDGLRDEIKPFVRNFLQIAYRFAIPTHVLCLPDNITRWVETMSNSDDDNRDETDERDEQDKRKEHDEQDTLDNVLGVNTIESKISTL